MFGVYILFFFHGPFTACVDRPSNEEIIIAARLYFWVINNSPGAINKAIVHEGLYNHPKFYETLSQNMDNM